jgi:three-Cys-motif partner protein
MAAKDIFDEPFKESTLAKLEIFEKYIDSWLPTFIMADFNKKPIQIFDLFAGSGSDVNGVFGSPLRIIKIISKHKDKLVQKNKKVKIFLNDLDSKKINSLKKKVDRIIADHSLLNSVEVVVSNSSFKECLKSYNQELKIGCNLIVIDQNGFKEVDEPIFQYMIGLSTTEFMFFISSSFIHRFVEQDEVKKYHPKFDSEKIKNTPRRKIHNTICEEFKKYVPANIKSYLIPFSIMKEDNNNIYGIIFVTTHPLGADKFLRTVWKKNALNGNADYDIENEKGKDQGDLFEERKLSKIQSFQKQLRENIIERNLLNNFDVYLFTINQGHISQHADEEIKRMKKDGSIYFDGTSALVNYDQVFKKHRNLEYGIIMK